LAQETVVLDTECPQAMLAVLLHTAALSCVVLSLKVPHDQQNNRNSSHNPILDLVKRDLGEPCRDEVAIVSSGVAAGNFCVPLDMRRPATEMVRDHKTWEPETHGVIHEHLQKVEGDVITAGLFFGDYLPHLSRVVGHNHRVWGFEPSSKNYAAARGTVWENNLLNIWLGNAALGNSSGGSIELCVAVGSGHSVQLGGESHTVRAPQEAARCSVEYAPLVAIDDVVPIERQVSAIHLDVEGAELDALRGAQRVIQQWQPLIVLEANRVGRQRQFMEQLHYKQVAKHEANLMFMPSSKHVPS